MLPPATLDDQHAPLWPSSPVGDLVRQGERAALAAGAHFPRAGVLAAGELRIAHILLAALVPPLVERDPTVYGYAVKAADALRGAWDDPNATRIAADAIMGAKHARALRLASPPRPV